MSAIKHAVLALLLLALSQHTPAWAEERAREQLVGLSYMEYMVEAYKSAKQPLQITAVFHGGLGYALLGDATYNSDRKLGRAIHLKTRSRRSRQRGGSSRCA